MEEDQTSNVGQDYHENEIPLEEKFAQEEDEEEEEEEEEEEVEYTRDWVKNAIFS